MKMNTKATFQIVLSLALMVPAVAQQARQQQSAQLTKANAEIATLKKKVNELTEERDALQQRVSDIPLTTRQENAELFRQLDESQAQKEEALARVRQLEGTLKENQSGGESLLRELRQAKNDLLECNNNVASMEKELESLQTRLDNATKISEGALAHLGPDIIPARCLNLRRMTPSVKKASGAVVINCLINERGDTVDVRLIQGLPGEATEWVQMAHEACLEAAKHLVFEPAATADGVRLKVWQGVAFNLK
jgi:DNA repair exonuclease SbcCD ATPase subunit